MVFFFFLLFVQANRYRIENLNSKKHFNPFYVYVTPNMVLFLKKHRKPFVTTLCGIKNINSNRLKQLAKGE